MSEKKQKLFSGAKSHSVPFGIFTASKAKPVAGGEELYTLPESEKSQTAVPRFLFDPKLWVASFLQHSNPKSLNPVKLRALRVLVQIGTCQACVRNQFFLPDGTAVELKKTVMEKAARGTIRFDSEHKFNVPKLKTEVVAVGGDCLDVAIRLKLERKFNPLVLNMASRSHPGGGFLAGAGAQEENLHRRSSLVHCLLDPWKLSGRSDEIYPIPEFGGLYSPDVPVFRGSEAAGYPFLPRPVLLSFVSAAAFSNPPLSDGPDGEPVLTGKVESDTRRKIRAIFSIGAEQGHDCLVLSAFGCGAYRNPPRHMARLFMQELNTNFANVFKAVVFAIYDDHNAQKQHNLAGNLKPFAEVVEAYLTKRDGAAPSLKDSSTLTGFLHSAPAAAATSASAADSKSGSASDAGSESKGSGGSGGSSEGGAGSAGAAAASSAGSSDSVAAETKSERGEAQAGATASGKQAKPKQQQKGRKRRRSKDSEDDAGDMRLDDDS